MIYSNGIMVSPRVDLIYNRPITAYKETNGILIEASPLNISPLTASNITLARSAFGIESLIAMYINLSGVDLMSGGS